MTIGFGPDPVADDVRRHLQALERGERLPERVRVDYKEEAGRRDKGGRVLPGSAENERAAQQLAREASCMANTPGGGALIIGVNDKNDGPLLIGTDLDEEWLRFRIYQATNRLLTVDVQPVTVRGVRLLVVTAPRAIEPIRFDGKIRWRVGTTCQEVDAASWHAGQRVSLRFDWSAQPSSLSSDAVRPAALEAVRGFLQASRDPHAQELADVPTADLLRRLNAVDGDGQLTNAAALTFVGRAEPCIDYIRRDAPGQDSMDRVRDGGRSLLEQLQETFALARAYNPIRHVGSGLAAGQVRQLPERAIREAIVNGVAHREWGLPEPTVIEHEGGVLRVTSPGGFYGGVTADNIITHPSSSRNTALTELLASLKIAEREGIGVDRMVRDLLTLGLRAPGIREIPGPHVVTTLTGATPDEAWMDWLAAFDHVEIPRNLRLLMAVRLLVDQLWLDEQALAPVIQLPVDEARDVIDELVTITVRGSHLLAPVQGAPTDSAPVYTIAAPATELLSAYYAEHHRARPVPSRTTVARRYARARGRISTTELASLVGGNASNMGTALRELEADGLLEPSSSSRSGRGFHYRWVRDDHE